MSDRILLMHTDLLFAAKIREAAAVTKHQVVPFRTVEEFRNALSTHSNSRLMLDLNSTKLDPFEVLELALQWGLETPVCFYSHVNEELAERAGEFNGVHCLRRSQFVNELSKILNSWQ